MVTYHQYVNRLVEWTDGYLDLLSARIDFEDMLSYGFSLDEAFHIVIALREEDQEARDGRY